MNRLIRIALTFLLVMTSGVIQAEIVIYPVPQGIYYARHNDDYTVKVRQVGEKDWVDLYEYNVKVDMDTKSDATMVQFDFSGKVEVLVQKNNGELRSAVVRPLSKGFQQEIDGNFLLFTLDKPQKLSVEFNGDRLNNLHVFANPIIENVPDKNDPNVMYFESGIHEPTDVAGKCFRIPSNTTVYLEGGAVLKGCLTCDSVENVKILGHGMLLEPQQGISVAYSKNVLIDGITVVNSRHYTVSGGQSQGITIKNLKSFSYQGWSDGLDFMSCSDVVIDDVFLRNSDDCIAIYTHRWNYYGDSRNIRVLNSTLWADIAHPINIGTHGNTKTGDEVLEDILFKNIDIGAPAAAMDIMTAKVDKEIRNGANRAMNCDMANVNKTVDAALEQTAAISRLAESGRLALLPEKLRQAAQLRLDNPEMSLQQLAERSDPPVSKSCMNHRMRRLMEEARESHE